MLPADWSISTSHAHDPLPSSCHSEKMLWNPSIERHRVLSLTHNIISMQCNVGVVSFVATIEHHF